MQIMSPRAGIGPAPITVYPKIQVLFKQFSSSASPYIRNRLWKKEDNIKLELVLEKYFRLKDHTGDAWCSDGISISNKPYTATNLIIVV